MWDTTEIYLLKPVMFYPCIYTYICTTRITNLSQLDVYKEQHMHQVNGYHHQKKITELKK
jgi:alkyl hydroperoxide reductase subunit AhpC